MGLLRSAALSNDAVRYYATSVKFSRKTDGFVQILGGLKLIQSSILAANKFGSLNAVTVQRFDKLS